MIKEIRPYGEEITVGSTSSVLSSLFRRVLNGEDISLTRFNTMMDKYILRGMRDSSIKDASSKRGNLKNELLQDTMTWSVFIKGLHFLGINSFDVEIKLYVHNGEDSSHFESGVLNSKMPIPENKSADRLLARLFHKILFERNYSLVEFSKLMDSYISKSSGPSNIRDVSSRKGNFKKELFKDKMSWNVFVKGITLLDVWKFDITVYLHAATGRTYVHGRSIEL